MTGFEVYTDGSYSRPKNLMGAGWVIYSPSGELFCKGNSISHRGNGTSFIAEAFALLEGLRQLPSGADAVIYSDSQNILNALSGPGKSRKKLGEMFIEELDKELERLGNLDFRRVMGHAGVRGNEMADELASAALLKGTAHTSAPEKTSTGEGVQGPKPRQQNVTRS